MRWLASVRFLSSARCTACSDVNSTVGPEGVWTPPGDAGACGPFMTWAIKARAFSRPTPCAAAGAALAAATAATSQNDAVLLTKSLRWCNEELRVRNRGGSVLDT